MYLVEKAALLEVLKEGDRVLWDMAKEFVDAWNEKREINVQW